MRRAGGRAAWAVLASVAGPRWVPSLDPGGCVRRAAWAVLASVAGGWWLCEAGGGEGSVGGSSFRRWTPVGAVAGPRWLCEAGSVGGSSFRRWTPVVV